MGRTVAPFRDVVKHDLEALEKFGRALRKPDREAFEEMLLEARKHLYAGSYASFLDSYHAIIMSVLLEHEKKLKGKA